MEEAKKKAEELLQMPPVVKEREPITEVLSRDPALTGLANGRYVFTDISFGLSDRVSICIHSYVTLFFSDFDNFFPFFLSFHAWSNAYSFDYTKSLLFLIIILKAE